MKRNIIDFNDETEKSHDLSIYVKHFFVVVLSSVLSISFIVIAFYCLWKLNVYGDLESQRSLGIGRHLDVKTNYTIKNDYLEFGHLNFINYYNENISSIFNVVNNSVCPRIVAEIPIDSNGNTKTNTKRLKFQTCMNGNLIDSLVINEDGSVTIKRITIESGITIPNFITLLNSSVVIENGLKVKGNITLGDPVYLNSIDLGNGDSVFLLQTSNNGSLVDSLYVDKNGKIGILNKNPQKELDVTGSGKFSGSLTVNGNLTTSSISASGPVNIDTSLNVGTTTTLNNLFVGGNAIFRNLTASSISTSGPAFFGSGAYIDGPSIIASSLYTVGTFRASGASSFDNNLVIGGTTRSIGGFSCDTNAVIGGTFRSIGSASCDGAFTVGTNLQALDSLAAVNDVTLGRTLRIGGNGIVFNGFTTLGNPVIGIDTRVLYVSGNPLPGLDLNHGGTVISNHYFLTTNTSSGLNGNSGLIQSISGSGVLATQFYSVNGYNIISSSLVKTNITNTTISSSLNRLMNVRIVDFQYIESYRTRNGKNGGIYSGVIAEEVREYYPNAISNVTFPDNTTTTNYKTVDYTSFTPDAIKIIQYQQNKISELITTINLLIVTINSMNGTNIQTING